MISVLLPKKQEEVLEAINRFGVISSTQLSEYLKGKVSSVTIYAARPRLIELGFIAEEKIGRKLILYMRPSGVDYLGSSLTPFTKINFSGLKHQLLMNECILSLKRLALKSGSSFDFITERELRSNYLAQNFSKVDRQNPTLLKKLPDQIPDFVVIENGNSVAHEVELTQKSHKRYLRKFDMYAGEVLSGRYTKVRYLCDSEKIKQVVIKAAAEKNFRKDVLQLELIERLMQFANKE